MARGLSATVQTYLANQSQIRVLLIDITTPSSTIYYTTAPFDVDYSGNTYTAQGNFLGVSNVEENAELIITSCQLVISAIDTANITTYATSSIINKSVIVRSAYLDPTDNSIVGTPIITFKGKITGYTISDADATATIALEVASTFANFDKTNGRYTNEGSFHREHAQDRGMEFAHESLQDLKWGRA